MIIGANRHPNCALRRGGARCLAGSTKPRPLICSIQHEGGAAPREGWGLTALAWARVRSSTTAASPIRGGA